METMIFWGIHAIIFELIMMTGIYAYKLFRKPSTTRNWAPAIAAPHRPSVAQVQQNFVQAPQQPAARPVSPPVQQTVVNIAPAAPVAPAAPPAPQPDVLDRPSLADDYYTALGVANDADEATIKSAYRQLMRQWHPDTCKLAGADNEVRAINEAYEVLSDDDERQKYDAGLWLQDEVK